MRKYGSFTEQVSSKLRTSSDNKEVTLIPPATLSAGSNSFITPSISGTSDTLISRTSTDTLTNKTLTSPVISSITNTGTLTLPTSTDTLVARSTTDTLSNKTLVLPKIFDTSADHKYNILVNELVADRNITLPLLTGNDTFVFASHAETLTNKTINADSNTITNIDDADIKSGANINAAKLGTGVVDNTEFNYLNGVTSQLSGNTDVATLTNKTINGSANTITNVSLTSGVTGILPVANGGTNANSKTEGFDNLAPTTTKGDIIVSNGTDNIRFAVGADGQVLSANSLNASGLDWTSPLTNPMDSEGDLIVGGVGGAATKLDSGTANYILQANGIAAPSWVLINNANIDAAAAIAVNKLAAVTASRALASDGSGFITATSVTSTELGYLSGVTAPTGTGALVLANTPTLITPIIGVATGTSLSTTTSVSAGQTSGTVTLTSGTATPIVIDRQQAAVAGPTIEFDRRGAFGGSSTDAVITNGVLGNLLFKGWDGDSYAEAGYIRVRAAANFSGTSSPGKMEFLTTPTGTQTAVEVLSLSSAGLVTIGESGGTQTHVINGSVSATSTVTAQTDIRTGTSATANTPALGTYSILGNRKGHLVISDSAGAEIDLYGGIYYDGSGTPFKYSTSGRTGGRYTVFASSSMTSNVHSWATGTILAGADNASATLTTKGGIDGNGKWTIGEGSGTQIHAVNGDLAITGSVTATDATFTTPGAGSYTPLSINTGAALTTDNQDVNLIVKENNTTNYAALGMRYETTPAGVVGYLFTKTIATTGLYWYGAKSSTDVYVTTNTAQLGTTSGLLIGAQTSDERLKTNIINYTDGLAKVLQLQPIRYNIYGREEVGFGAQTTEAVIPEAVRITGERLDAADENSPSDLRQMEYARLIPALVNAIKELTTRLEALENA